MSSASSLAAGGSHGCTEVGVVLFGDSRVRNDLEIELHMRAIVTVAETALVRIILGRRSARRVLCASNITLRASDCGETQKYEPEFPSHGE